VNTFHFKNSVNNIVNRSGIFSPLEGGKILFKKQVLAIVGQSGAGKSLFSKELSSLSDWPLLVCSELGTVIARKKYNCNNFGECFLLSDSFQFICDLNRYWVHQALDILSYPKMNTLIFDGLVSIDAICKLEAYGIDVKVIYLDTPYEVRIDRIMKRSNCTREEALCEETEKIVRKDRLGINEVLQLVDYRLDGTKRITEILEDFSTLSNITLKSFSVSKQRNGLYVTNEAASRAAV